MLATWGYGVWKGGEMLYYSLPLGLGAMFCTVGALAIPSITAVIVAVAFLLKIDDGLTQAVRNAAAAFLAVGTLAVAWFVLRRIVLRAIGRS